MKWLIASDLHGSAPCCAALLEAFDREGAGRLLLLGDLLYHGPRNDLPAGYDPKGASALLNARREVILCVRGNCEAEVDQMMLEFPVLADYALIWTGRRALFATHGHHFGGDALPPLSPGDVLLQGHTHIPAWEALGANWRFNPGSVTLPKNGAPQSYMTLEDDLFTWKTLAGEVYHTEALSGGEA